LKVQAPAKPIETPLMKQYNAIKAKYPDALLLFRVGDFYETFNEDAVKTANILGIVLTKRANGSAAFIDLAGFPYHALDTYLPKLVRAGQRVAICDQLEDPKATKTIVKRGVTELITPGVTFSDKILDHASNNFLCAIQLSGKDYGIAFADVSTGEFLCAEGDKNYIEKLLQSFNPSEVIYSKPMRKELESTFSNHYYHYPIDEWVFMPEYARESMLRHFETTSLKGYGIEDLPLATIAAGAILHYLTQTKLDNLKHITSVSRIDENKYVWLDKFTIRNLELVNSPHEKARTLIDIIDKTLSPMGARMLRRWILLPLKDLKPIEERLEAVSYFISNNRFKEELAKYLRQVGDLERIISKIAVKRISPREVNQLKRALEAIAPLKDLSNATGNEVLMRLAEQLNPCHLMLQKISSTLVAEPPALVTKGGVIAKGISPELDELRRISHSGKDYLLQLQQVESERTGIGSLKISFNNVFGYYLEVTNTHKHKVPAEWTRKQTVSNGERYITSELKEYEEKILGAEEKILALEEQLYNDLVSALEEYIQPMQLNASCIARLDCLHSFAETAIQNNYIRPHLNETLNLDIKDGRHAVLEKQMPAGEEYIANDIYLDNDSQQIIIITGPNMSGKSALLRQTALIVLLAQMGSYVPAKSANIGLIDKIFTRVGASDNISSGESTFMVEMNETASILNNISERSLILLDEIGRGTSTYDGISIAWAIAEFLHEHPHAHPKTLFATHYHELNEMAASMPRIRNFNVSIKEVDNRILFMRKLVSGGSEHSFGIHVARMAGMPVVVINKAQKMLETLEQSHSSSSLKKTAASHAAREAFQLSFFKLDDPLLEQVRDQILHTDINALTPVEALLKLSEIQKMMGK
jgi:DNA mismatch repair protein MutS